MAKLRLKNFETKTDVDDVYADRVKALQYRLQLIQAAYITKGLRGIVAIEGWDASGKGGLIKRMIAELDPRFTDVWPISAPNTIEKGEHYLERFWRRLPDAREIVVFDRTWYGRVLVERIDKFAAEPAWQRAYDEINQFEATQAADGVRIVKLFLHITQAEQDERLRSRLETPHKRWKTGLDDYHNRSLRAEYTKAYHDMFDRTSTAVAPWHIIPADSKKAARLAGLETVVAALGQGVDLSYPAINPDLREVAEAALGIVLAD